MKNRLVGLVCILLFTFALSAQTKVRIYGYVIDTNNRGIELANVYFENSKTGTTTNQNGYYELMADIHDSATIVYSMLGYQTIKHTIHPKQQIIQISVELPALSKEISELNVIGQRRQTSTVDMVDATKYRLMPNSNGGI